MNIEKNNNSEKPNNKENQKDDISKQRNTMINGNEGFTTQKNLDKNKNKIYMYEAKWDNTSIDQAKNALTNKLNKLWVSINKDQLHIYKSESDAISSKDRSDNPPKKWEKIYIRIDKISKFPEKSETISEKDFEKIDNIISQKWKTIKSENKNLENWVSQNTKIIQINNQYIQKTLEKGKDWSKVGYQLFDSKDNFDKWISNLSISKTSFTSQLNTNIDKTNYINISSYNYSDDKENIQTQKTWFDIYLDKFISKIK